MIRDMWYGGIPGGRLALVSAALSGLGALGVLVSVVWMLLEHV